ncbi:hypothetical protein AHAS_Ahas08G0034900 [Arachis hypogaea]
MRHMIYLIHSSACMTQKLLYHRYARQFYVAYTLNKSYLLLNLTVLFPICTAGECALPCRTVLCEIPQSFGTSQPEGIMIKGEESPAILRYKDQFKEAIFLAFDSTSWKDLKSFSSFIMAILLRISDKDNHTCGLGFSDLVSQIGSMSFDSTGLHWRPLFEEFEKSTFSDKDTCNFGFEYTLKEITVQAVTWPTMILCGIDNIRDLFGPKVDLGLIKKNSICRLGIN